MQRGLCSITTVSWRLEEEQEARVGGVDPQEQEVRLGWGWARTWMMSGIGLSFVLEKMERLLLK